MNAEKWHALEVTDALDKLKTSPQGLTSQDASYRLRQYGFNEVAAVGKIAEQVTVVAKEETPLEKGLKS